MSNDVTILGQKIEDAQLRNSVSLVWAASAKSIDFEALIGNVFKYGALLAFVAFPLFIFMMSLLLALIGEGSLMIPFIEYSARQTFGLTGMYLLMAILVTVVYAGL